MPNVVSVPEINPVWLLRVNPSGKCPELTDQVTFEPFDVRSLLYVSPTAPLGRLEVVTASALIVMLRFFVVLDEPDAALTVKVDVPSKVGVPEIMPNELSVRPGGRLPNDTDQTVSVGFDVSAPEYSVPTTPEGSLVVIMVIAVPSIIRLNAFSAEAEPLDARTVKL